MNKVPKVALDGVSMSWTRKGSAAEQQELDGLRERYSIRRIRIEEDPLHAAVLAWERALKTFRYCPKHLDTVKRHGI